jgi:hypothetical protein
VDRVEVEEPAAAAAEEDEEAAAFLSPEPFESGPPEPEPSAEPESLAGALDSPVFSFVPVREPLPERLSVR